MVCYLHAFLTTGIILPQTHKSMVTTQNQSVKCDMFVHLWFTPCGQTRGMRRKNRNLMMKGNTSK